MSALRVDADLGLDVFWTRDHQGRIGIQFTLASQTSSPPKPPRLKGISTWTQNSPPSVRLTLAEEKDWEIFLSLAEDLLHQCGKNQDRTDLLGRLYARLGRWQRLLEKERRRVLSEQEIRGLMGELNFLRQELVPRFGPASVSFWQGPSGAPQDFAVGLMVLEIKTRSPRSPSRIAISSPQQLWPSLPDMYLVVYPVAVSNAIEEGESLASLVNVLRKLLEGSAQAEEFEEKLESLGYLDLPEYEEQHFVVGPAESYRVREGFPSIPPGGIPAGVVDVRYWLELETCRDFRAEVPWHASGGN